MVVLFLTQHQKHKTEINARQAEGQRLLKKGRRTQRENERINRLKPTAETMKEMDSKIQRVISVEQMVNLQNLWVVVR